MELADSVGADACFAPPSVTFYRRNYTVPRYHPADDYRGRWRGEGTMGQVLLLRPAAPVCGYKNITVASVFIELFG